MNRHFPASAFAALCLLITAEVSAHAIGVSRGTYQATDHGVSADLVFAQQEIAASLPEIDSDHDGRIATQELDAHQALFAQWLQKGLRLRAATLDCTSMVDDAQLTSNDGLQVKVHYDCNGAVAPYRFEFELLDQLGPGHRHIATLHRASGDLTHVLYASASMLVLEAGSTASTSTLSAGWPLVKLGIEHIATGYDHLVFLFGLMLVAAGLRNLIYVITAFTLGHSITLAIATLGLWMPSPAWIEPLIALSIVYVGIENYVVRDTSRRWPLTLAFGLIHGFGFAGVLREIDLPQNDLPLALLSFNAGVELGQLVILLLVLPIVTALRKRAWFARGGVLLLNAGIALAGALWFLERIL